MNASIFQAVLEIGRVGIITAMVLYDVEKVLVILVSVVRDNNSYKSIK